MKAYSLRFSIINNVSLKLTACKFGCIQQVIWPKMFFLIQISSSNSNIMHAFKKKSTFHANENTLLLFSPLLIWQILKMIMSLY